MNIEEMSFKADTKIRTPSQSKSWLFLLGDTSNSRHPSNNNSHNKKTVKARSNSSLKPSSVRARSHYQQSDLCYCDSPTNASKDILRKPLNLSNHLNSTRFNLDSQKLSESASATSISPSLPLKSSRVCSIAATPSSQSCQTKYCYLNPAITKVSRETLTPKLSAIDGRDPLASRSSMFDNRDVLENFKTNLLSMPAKTSFWLLRCFQQTLQSTLCIILIRAIFARQSTGLMSLLLYASTVFQCGQAGFACLSNPCVFGVCIDGLNR